ncbi:MAG: hypothetical protein KGD63_07715 [Candidatus Lokiarchaeota archaeon]|nr:hypothetical protein [Candidatus Lokiarchaeota archaeon]
MKTVRDRILLLALLNIFFVYKIITGLLGENQSETLLWSLILIVYLISLTMLYFVMKKSSENAK